MGKIYNLINYIDSQIIYLFKVFNIKVVVVMFGNKFPVGCCSHKLFLRSNITKMSRDFINNLSLFCLN